MRVDCRCPAASGIGGIEGAQVVEGNAYDLLVKEEGEQHGLYLSGGELLCRVEKAEETVGAARAFVKTRELLNLRNPRRDFNVWLDAEDYDGKTVFRAGDKLSFKIRSEADAQLLLVSVDWKGDVCVLLPESEDSTVPIPRNGVFHLKNLGIVVPPFGVDFLKVFAFSRKVEGLSAFAAGGGVFNCSDAKFEQLVKLIERQEGWSEASMQVVTVKAP